VIGFTLSAPDAWPAVGFVNVVEDRAQEENQNKGGGIIVDLKKFFCNSGKNGKESLSDQMPSRNKRFYSR